MGTIVSCYSDILILAETLTLWITSTALVCCLVITITIVLGAGVGVGYNYCFVNMKTKFRYVPINYTYHGKPLWSHINTEGTSPMVFPNGYILKMDQNAENLEEFGKYINPEFQDIINYNNETNLDNKTLNVKNEAGNITTIASVDYLTSDDNGALKDEIKTKIIQADNKVGTMIKRSSHIIEVPITGLDLIDFLSKLKVENKNYTIQIIDT